MYLKVHFSSITVDDVTAASVTETLTEAIATEEASTCSVS